MNTRARKSATKHGLVSSFTYYIPAPGARKSGYREREFDKIMSGILHAGFKILEFKTHSVGGDHGGLYVLAILQAPNKKVAAMDLGQEIQENFRLAHSHSSPDIVLEDEDED